LSTLSARSRPLANIGAVGALLALTFSARAADLGAPAPPPPPPILAAPTAPWAGLYIGSVYGIGYASVHSSQTGSGNASAWGQTVGAVAGYSFETNRFVYGPEGEFSWHVLRPQNPGGTGLAENVYDTLDTFRLRARLGYDLGQFLPYVAGGVAEAKIYQYNYPYPLLATGQTREDTGLTLGAGLEWRFVAPVFGQVTVRGEYVYDYFPDQTYALIGGPMRSRASEQFFRVGIIDYPDEAWHPPANMDAKWDWSGAYGGFLAGGLWATPRTSLGGVTTTYDAAGGEFGIFTGYNFMFGPWVLGYEGAAAVANASGTGPQPGIAAASYREYLDADLRARAGYAFGRFLPYATLGADWGRSEQTDLATGSFRGRIPSENATVGGGLEYAISDRWSARVEYLYAWPVGGGGVTNLDAAALEQTRTAQTVRVGLAYYFH
jgi:opacity protein-like surface antigen